MNLPIKVRLCSLLAILILSAGILCACSSPAQPPTPSPEPGDDAATVVEVVYFHRSQRCAGCHYAEDATRYTIETYFGDEVASGKVVFKVLDVQDKANAAIVEKYGAYTSSLFINEVRDGIDHIEEVTGIWFLLGNDEAFVNLVKGEIEKHL